MFRKYIDILLKMKSCVSSQETMLTFRKAYLQVSQDICLHLHSHTDICFRRPSKNVGQFCLCYYIYCEGTDIPKPKLFFYTSFTCAAK